MMIKNKIKHIAIIMDGNGRWAKNRKIPMPRSYGHKKGALNAKQIIKFVSDLKIPYLSLFAFSTENWKRPKEEIEFIFDMISKFYEKEKQFFIESDIKIKIIGSLENLDNKLKDQISYIQNQTKNNKGTTLIIAFNYSGKWDILNSISQLILQNSSLLKKNIPKFVQGINEKIYGKYLSTKEMPDPDILIRTGDQQRISNFMLWQLAYTEIFFHRKMWPDFSKNDFIEIIDQYNSIERRFGALV